MRRRRSGLDTVIQAATAGLGIDSGGDGGYLASGPREMRGARGEHPESSQGLAAVLANPDVAQPVGL